MAGPDTPPKSPGAEATSTPAATEPTPSPSSEQLSVMSDGEKSLLDPLAAPPAAPSEFPMTVRAARPYPSLLPLCLAPLLRSAHSQVSQHSWRC